MHPLAYEWVEKHAPRDAQIILDIGGRDINGTTRPIFKDAGKYVSMDLYDGPGVDIVGDASKPLLFPYLFDVVVCAEVFEHADTWPKIVENAFHALRPGGLFIATMAGPGRTKHSAIDGKELQECEWYENVAPDILERVLKELGFVDIIVDYIKFDTRCVARRP